MKSLILLLLLIFLCGCGKDPIHSSTVSESFTCDDGVYALPKAHPQFPLNPRFLVAGQSNSVSSAQQHPDYYSQKGFVVMNDPDKDNDPDIGIILTTPTITNLFHAGIAWIYMADFLNVLITVEIVGEGNTSTRKWKQYLYKRLITALSQNNYDAILWVQGESDWGENIPMEETCSNLKWLINTSHSIQPDLDWYIALDSHKDLPENNRVRTAEKAVIAQGYALQGPDLDVLRTNPLFIEPGGGEFVGAGLEEHGRVWYEILKDRFN